MEGKWKHHIIISQEQVDDYVNTVLSFLLKRDLSDGYRAKAGEETRLLQKSCKKKNLSVILNVPFTYLDNEFCRSDEVVAHIFHCVRPPVRTELPPCMYG